MEKSESRRPLLNHDCNEQWKLDNEGISSGYDSSIDASDTESAHENEDCYTANKDEEEEYKEVIRFRNTSAICEQLRYILSMPELCDVSFLVGPNKIPVYGVRAVIGSRSSVLYQMILDGLRETQENGKKKSRQSSRLLIEIKTYEPEDFRRIIQFVHCGSTDVSINNVTGLLCGASEYCLKDLKLACRDFIRRYLMSDANSVLRLLNNAQRYRLHPAGNKLISKVTAQYSRMSSQNFPMLCVSERIKEQDQRKMKSESWECKGSRTTTV